MTIAKIQADFISYTSFFKGNYAKGANRLRAMLNTPDQAAELLASKAALAALLSGIDGQSPAVQAAIRDSGRGDDFASAYIASMGYSDAADFMGDAPRDSVANVLAVADTIDYGAWAAPLAERADVGSYILGRQPAADAARMARMLPLAPWEDVTWEALDAASAHAASIPGEGIALLLGRTMGVPCKSSSSGSLSEYTATLVAVGREATGALPAFGFTFMLPLSGQCEVSSLDTYKYSWGDLNPDSTETAWSSYHYPKYYVNHDKKDYLGYAEGEGFYGLMKKVAKRARKCDGDSAYKDLSSRIASWNEMLWVPSASEVFGAGASVSGAALPDEGDQYQFFEDPANRARTLSSGSVGDWWTRTDVPSTEVAASGMSYTGNVYGQIAYVSSTGGLASRAKHCTSSSDKKYVATCFCV